MRRRVVIVPLLALAGVLLARRRRRARAVPAPLTAPPQAPLAPAAPALDPGTSFVSVPWTLVDAPPDEPRLTIRCKGDEQMELDRIDAQETPTQVFVTALMRRRPAPGGPPPPAREHEAVVPLGRPLGPRELVHAPVDEPNGPPLYP